MFQLLVGKKLSCGHISTAHIEVSFKPNCLLLINLENLGYELEHKQHLHLIYKLFCPQAKLSISYIPV